MATEIKLRENAKIRENQDFETKGYRLEVHLTSPMFKQNAENLNNH